MVHELSPSEVNVATVPLDRLTEVLPEDAARDLMRAAEQTRRALGDRVVWNFSSTATGGGVAEMLHPLLAYGRGAGIDVRWVVIAGDEEFFAITKRVHHGIHGEPGSVGNLGEAETRHAEEISHHNFEELRALVRPGDIAICHDPQTTWLVPPLVEHGLAVVWRCHIGTDRKNQWTERAWNFIGPVTAAHRYVFSRPVYVPDHLADRSVIIPPSIDPFSPKNCEFDHRRVQAVLAHIGVLRTADVVGPRFTRADGTPGRIDHVADVVTAGPMAGPDTPMVVQVSRWDPLKDMVGVMHAFSEHVDGRMDAQLVLAGPNVSGVTDDPEGAEVLEDCIAQWRDLPHESRSRILLACLPMADVEENAIMVNALQRHAAVVVQKSLQEGFGLTVSEAMWKARPMVASRVGGIQDQVVDGETGLLVEPTDGAAFGAALVELLDDHERADAMGAAGRERVRHEFLGHRHLRQYADLLIELAEG